jgi:hypothetical protein
MASEQRMGRTQILQVTETVFGMEYSVHGGLRENKINSLTLPSILVAGVVRRLKATLPNADD